ncbi:imidazole glycerol phosphate synthase, glutamine amidotransferase subunit [Anoxybacter fermentans]|uniref:Imidazole glycerol phosphate synthase subunit HisH n=1 Tax=Anoxybacter fermentans TaxID=1323375 RepID=A0A3Q9HS42_9FIRM|nr:imidazole glycerol phosphate synthase subunit HisH [Anoxybacter fermentans]AZR74029.1 imidazole glycerol phosphate synthase, glutamine amidotransferase subunit [Anoxybacter fermentans]
MIGIIDYGMGNLKSIRKAMEYLNYPVKMITRPEEIQKMSGLILPGVGAFPKAMENLIRNGFVEAIKYAIDQGKPFLGICLGMQLLFEVGYEDQKASGLGFLSGEVKRLKGGVKIPHMGWNRIYCKVEHPLWQGLSKEPYMYFVHSYALSEMTDDVIATTIYGEEIPVAVARENIMGVQFHPEKSGDEGLRILKNFGEMV